MPKTRQGPKAEQAVDKRMLAGISWNKRRNDESRDYIPPSARNSTKARSASRYQGLHPQQPKDGKLRRAFEVIKRRFKKQNLKQWTNVNIVPPVLSEPPVLSPILDYMGEDIAMGDLTEPSQIAAIAFVQNMPEPDVATGTIKMVEAVDAPTINQAEEVTGITISPHDIFTSGSNVPENHESDQPVGAGRTAHNTIEAGIAQLTFGCTLDEESVDEPLHDVLSSSFDSRAGAACFNTSIDGLIGHLRRQMNIQFDEILELRKETAILLETGFDRDGCRLIRSGKYQGPHTSIDGLINRMRGQMDMQFDEILELREEVATLLEIGVDKDGYPLVRSGKRQGKEKVQLEEEIIVREEIGGEEVSNSVEVETSAPGTGDCVSAPGNDFVSDVMSSLEFILAENTRLKAELAASACPCGVRRRELHRRSSNGDIAAYAAESAQPWAVDVQAEEVFIPMEELTAHRTVVEGENAAEVDMKTLSMELEAFEHERTNSAGWNADTTHSEDTSSWCTSPVPDFPAQYDENSLGNPMQTNGMERTADIHHPEVLSSFVPSPANIPQYNESSPENPTQTDDGEWAIDITDPEIFSALFGLPVQEVPQDNENLPENLTPTDTLDAQFDEAPQAQVPSSSDSWATFDIARANESVADFVQSASVPSPTSGSGSEASQSDTTAEDLEVAYTSSENETEVSPTSGCTDNTAYSEPVERKIKPLPTKGRRGQHIDTISPSSSTTSSSDLDPLWEEKLKQQVASSIPLEFWLASTLPTPDTSDPPEPELEELLWDEEWDEELERINAALCPSDDEHKAHPKQPRLRERQQARARLSGRR